MNQKEAKEHGIDAGESAVAYCEVSDVDRREASCDCKDEQACEECLSQAAFDSEMHVRDFSPYEFLAHEINTSSPSDRADGLWFAYDEGVALGIKRGLKARLKEVKKFAQDEERLEALLD